MYQCVQNARDFFFHLRVCFALAGDPVEKIKGKSNSGRFMVGPTVRPSFDGYSLLVLLGKDLCLSKESSSRAKSHG